LKKFYLYKRSGAVAFAVSPGADMKEWYISRGGKQFGPFTYSEVNSRLAGNEISYNDYVYKDGMSDWVKIGSLPQFGSRTPSSPTGSTMAGVQPPIDPAADSTRCWYTYASGKQEGPFTVSEIMIDIQNQRLTYQDYAWTERFGSQWKLIGEIPELNRRSVQAATPPGMPLPGSGNTTSPSSAAAGTTGENIAESAGDDSSEPLELNPNASLSENDFAEDVPGEGKKDDGSKSEEKPDSEKEAQTAYFEAAVREKAAEMERKEASSIGSFNADGLETSRNSLDESYESATATETMANAPPEDETADGDDFDDEYAENTAFSFSCGYKCCRRTGPS